MTGEPASGIIVDRYEILESLGTGGFGEIYLCRDLVLSRDVALKVLKPEVSGDLIRRFQNEARIAARLDHRNIVNVVDFGDTGDGRLFLAMEYLKGESLEDLLRRRGTLTLDEFLPLLSQICHGLSFAHGKGVLHRDIKPANVMLVTDDQGEAQVKLVDFGIAKLASDDQSVTRAGNVIGSPLYISPETALGKPADPRSDIYSLGCLIFEVLAGAPPFTGDTLMEAMTARLENEAPLLSSVSRESLADGSVDLIDSIVARCLSRDPANRFASIADLEAALAGLQIAGDEISEGLPAVEPAKRPRPLLLLCLALIVLSGGLAGLYCLSLSNGALEPEPGTHKPLPDDPGLARIPFTDPDFVFDHRCAQDGYRWLKLVGLGTDRDLYRLRGREDFRYLLMEHDEMVGEGMKVLEELPLLGLSFRRCGIDNKVLEHVGKIKTLTQLELVRSSGFDARGLACLKNCPKLSILSLSDTDIGDNEVEELTGIESLKRLDLGGCEAVTGAGLAALAGTADLEELILNKTSIKPEELNLLKRFKNLRVLSVTGLDLTDDDVRMLVCLPVTTLDVSNNKITRKSLSILAADRRLVTLKVLDCDRVTSKDIADFIRKRPDINLRRH
ncbi:MAG: protein kinase [Candidatus Melainabacteria bacterium]|nr:protein kinase [Candidatus Melainabacteria bacterium]